MSAQISLKCEGFTKLLGNLGEITSTSTRHTVLSPTGETNLVLRGCLSYLFPEKKDQSTLHDDDAMMMMITFGSF